MARTNTAILEDIVSDKQYLTSACIKLSIPTDETKFTEIKNIRGLKNTRRFHWIKARSYVKVLNQSFWYMSCSNCNKISSEKFGDVYDCIYCKCTDVKAIPRAKVFLQLEDSTGNINASAIGNPAECFLHSNAQALMEGTNTVNLEINDEKVFYVKTISKPHSSDFKLEVIFMFDSSNTSQEIKDENDKGNTTTSNASNTPPSKRALFRCDDATSTSNKKIASPENEDQGKKNTYKHQHIGVNKVF